ncbi:M23 family metallopeptidase [Staphylococcus edaphicus]|uniref:lysostaphin n=1 Tax=Staphylococcus edaphicus TaxID=1955013 RepID=A0A2C6WRA3_9STAP|nr:M23 family metallopeptidase [Staphylococcus edaphicus]PHK50615.1 peptidase M23 [Staphylococcus edaphicus]UQW80713.1 M23 family metallopeptidase [Staphylococcus edaphicus]
MEIINAQKIINKIEQNDARWLYDHFSESFQDISSFEELEKLLNRYNTLRSENVLFRHLNINRHDEYIWFDNKMATGASVTLNKYQEIIGMSLLPISHKHNVKQSKYQYTIPIKTSCLVYWGGDNELINFHYRFKQQRHALDLVKIKDGYTYKGNSNECANYYSYGLPIVAPANGVVEAIVDGIPDNTPGDINTVHPEGNYIIIKHARNEYSMIAHIKANSFKIEKGDTLLRGQHIANVGNSGNTPEPHIHFQVMKDKNIQVAQTLKIQFQNVTAPVKGDIVTYTGDQIMVNEKREPSKLTKGIRSNITHLFKS